MQKNPLIKPYLKWAGGKRQLLAEIHKYLPESMDDFSYYEPFVGAGAVFFDLQPKKAVINDSNSQLVLTYNVIKNNIECLIEALKEHQIRHCEEYYYEVRAQDRKVKEFQELNDVEKAARLIYLNKTCYNGLYRVNSHGLFNVPYGKYKNPSICEESVLRGIHRYFQTKNITILNGDFSDALCGVNRKSFVYFDPPYHSPDNANFTGYQANGFDKNEQIRLRNVAVELTRKGVKWLLSNSDTPFIREIYNDLSFEIITVSATRRINSVSSGRGDINEVIVKNWK